MVRHVILWSLNDKYSADEKENIKKDIKIHLEGLLGKIPGLLDIKVNICALKSSNADLMLESCFESEKALLEYSENPLHVAVANTYVRPFTVSRKCLDFEE